MDIDDALAATKVWTEAVIRKNRVAAGAETFVFSDLAAVVKAIKDKRADLVVTLPLEYLAIKDKVPLRPISVGVARGKHHEEHVILVHRDRGTTEFAQLKGKKLVVGAGGTGSTAWMWLNTLAMKSGQADGEGFFQEIREVRKASQAILSVLFEKDNACLVTLGAFETMVELNPQLGRDLVVVTASPGLCGPIVSAREDIASDYGKVLEEGLRSLHEEPQGQQILELFHLDKLIPFQGSYLDGVIRLADDHNVLKAKLPYAKGR